MLNHIFRKVSAKAFHIDVAEYEVYLEELPEYEVPPFYF